VRIGLAGVAVLLVAASYAFLLANRQPRARARVTHGSTAVDLGGLAAEVQANIAAQHVQSAERSSQVDRHELTDPDEAPPASERPAIRRARALVKRWLAGYLPYEVDRLGPVVRRDISATSTAALTRSLLTHPPLIPPSQQTRRPPKGRLLGLLTTLSPGASRARVYVEVAYGLEREGFLLTLIRGERGWLVAAFHG
jgi:hypothetical protein